MWNSRPASPTTTVVPATSTWYIYSGRLQHVRHHAHPTVHATLLIHGANVPLAAPSSVLLTPPSPHPCPCHRAHHALIHDTVPSWVIPCPRPGRCALVRDANTFLAPPFACRPLLCSHLAPAHLPTLPPPLPCPSSPLPTPIRPFAQPPTSSVTPWSSLLDARQLKNDIVGEIRRTRTLLGRRFSGSNWVRTVQHLPNFR